jgi:hypothetical protein
VPGSGWLTDAGFIATAAHVLWGASLCEIRWADSPIWHPTADFKIHPKYGAGKNGSQVDAAKITNFPARSGGLLASSALPNAVMAIGFHNGELVEHAGPAKLVTPFIGHDADTGPGHSGCPVLVGDKVAGLHLGEAMVSQAFLPPKEAARLDSLNCALRFSVFASDDWSAS